MKSKIKYSGNEKLIYKMLEKLPDDVIKEILFNLDPEEILDKCSINITTKNIFGSNAFWYRIFKYKFSYINIENYNRDINYKDEYIIEIERRKNIRRILFDEDIKLISTKVLEIIYELVLISPDFLKMLRNVSQFKILNLGYLMYDIVPDFYNLYDVSSTFTGSTTKITKTLTSLYKNNITQLMNIMLIDKTIDTDIDNIHKHIIDYLNNILKHETTYYINEDTKINANYDLDSSSFMVFILLSVNYNLTKSSYEEFLIKWLRSIENTLFNNL